MRVARLVLLAVLAAAPVQADTPGAMELLSRYGCTLEAESRKALQAAGIEAAEISQVMQTALADGTARKERDFVVFSQEVCEIGLPFIGETAKLSDADIAAEISVVDHYEEEERRYAKEIGVEYSGEGEGCYFLQMPEAFDGRNGGERGAGTVDYIRFLGAHIASGEVRFYGPEPLKTPIALRVLAGACGDTEQGAAIWENHRFVREGFGDYVRRVGETPCSDAPSSQGMQIGVELQGFDPSSTGPADPPVNAWLFFEYEMIAMAAGWYEGMSGTSKGTPRPPLCTYQASE